VASVAAHGPRGEGFDTHSRCAPVLCMTRRPIANSTSTLFNDTASIQLIALVARHRCKNFFLRFYYFGHVFFTFLTFFIFQTFFYLKNVGIVTSERQAD